MSLNIKVAARSKFLHLLIAVAICAAIVFATFSGGLRRGLDHAASWGPDTDQRMIAIAISDVVYHLNLGYVSYGTVYNKLVKVWTQGVSNEMDLKLKDNGNNREILNSAIEEAASLGPQTPGYFDTPGSFVTGIYNDVGYSDLVALSFRLFGLKIESIYYTFFVVISISALLYLATFRGDGAAYAVISFALFCYFLELYSPVFVNGGAPTFAGPRHGSVLGLIPAWHFITLLFRRTKLSVVTLLTTALQFCLLAHAITTRGGAMAFVLAVIGVAIAVAAVPWWRGPKTERTWGKLFQGSAKWPVVLLVFGLLAHGHYQRSIEHPIYLSDDAMAYHGFWHVAHAGIIIYAPEYSGLTPEQLKIPAGDGWTYWMALKYMRDHHFLQSPEDNSLTPPTLMSPWTEHVKYRLYETIMQRVVTETFMKHPFGILRAYLLIKPVEIVNAAITVLQPIPGWVWLVSLACVSALAGVAFLGGITIGTALGMTGLGAVAMLMATAPAMWGYAGAGTNAEALVSEFMVILLAGWTVVLYALGRWCGKP